MGDTNKKWLYLGILSIIWGTSYILIKKGLLGFTPLQLGFEFAGALIYFICRILGVQYWISTQPAFWSAFGSSWRDFVDFDWKILES